MIAMERISGNYKFGDVVNGNGDILVRNPSLQNPDGIGLLAKGTVLVSEQQAEAAKEFGWRPLLGKREDKLIEVTRGTSSLLN